MENKSSRPTTIEDLPYEIRLKIFMSLSIVELCTAASQVCTSWRSTCRDPVLWNRIDLTKIGSHSNTTPADRRVLTVEQGSHLIMLVLKNALNLGGIVVTTLIFNLFMLLRTDYLVHAAKRSPNLRRLVLPVRHQIDGVGFEEAIKHWKNLESLTLPSTNYPNNMVQSIGTNCKSFFELKIMRPLDIDLANALITCIPHLKNLSLLYTRLSRKALVKLLKGMKQLEVLSLPNCTLVDDYEFDIHFDPRSIENEIRPLVSSLQKFVPWERVEYRGA